MSKSSRHWDELELYRIKLYKWDKYMASIFPLLILTFFAYQVESRPEVLWLGFGNAILIFFSIVYITPANFHLSKLVHFVAAFGVIFMSSILLPFLRYEYFLMPLTMLTVLSTYPFQQDRTNIISGIICIFSALVLYIIEINQNQEYPEYTQFNKVFQFILLYITFIEIIMTALIEKRYRDMIERDKNKMEDQKANLQKYIESNLQLENFAHLASHDLKTPLSNIVKFSQLLKIKTKDKLDKDEIELFDFIINGSKRMNNTIKSLFRFSQASNSKLSISIFDFNTFIEEILLELKNTIESNDVSINLLSPTIQIKADRILFNQLWHNLILNSIKFSKPDVAPIINIKVSKFDGDWLMIIEDNGIGIAQEYLENIFVIFKRLHSDNSIEGTGAGLAICKIIMQHHKGKIWAESDGSSGSTFYISLPN